MPEQLTKYFIPISYAEIVETYPAAQEWLADPINYSAQLLEGKRLLSAKEKIQMSGGKETLLQTYKGMRWGTRDKSLILQACKFSPMVMHEINRFVEEIYGTDTSIYVSTISNFTSLQKQGALRHVDGVAYIRRTDTLQGFEVKSARGYETTETGLRVFADTLTKRTGSWLGGLFRPKPGTQPT